MKNFDFKAAKMPVNALLADRLVNISGCIENAATSLTAQITSID